MALSADSRLDLGTVLVNGSGEKFLVIDALAGKVRLVRIPPNLTADDFGTRFRHAPEPGDPTRCQLVGAEDD